ncbi:IS200/IS605 family element transposase accessory protein TnpB [Streptomyces lunaelactis]|uniref:RNA-guided endonuclease InsQ/TnpB family protein n=1 Tax=Streptomyces lunaelactis TaxID=1535768 RepID=UPI001584AEEC|nr:RNA-guided endonuclease TnpB family protein [Streptomyces lunaelactis]NUK53038.1 IS200/IS605 family element transposase accessory protein TnpB [Streptomyces lunaelactis]NUK66964.1 IS200/IS605 family element transposase accessory protein TnpB [Streptomyces lunaelactis]NUK72686.1 IS200/IS605 family element transposase accessory protein TnpB [Streptomyces lunaelactis]NUK78240.1 IS200/IS605 family element transposase accessory protein TnpB [Streptomyces lunaelactis]
MADSPEKPVRVTGAEAKRIKRDGLGIADRRKHHSRPATPMKRRAKESGTQQRVYRFRFYPTPMQAEQLEQTFGACRWVYNEGLALRSGAWEQHRVSVGFAETCRALTGWRRSDATSWLRDVSSTVLQQALRHLEGAYSRFFKGTATYPKRKKKHRSRDSATYVRTGFRWVEDPERPGTGLVTLAKQPTPLDVRWSRALPGGQVPVKLTVMRDRAGRYFLSVLVEERILPLPAAFLPGGEPKAVGLDLGLAALVTLDDGTKLDHPRLLKKYADELARKQRELHRKKKGSKNREKARKRIARLYVLIGDVRRDMLDQFTTRLVRENQVLVVEGLCIANLMRPTVGKGRRRKARLNQAIRDAAWGELLRQLRYKCEWYGRTLVIVDRFFPSTRRCSACHTKGPRLDVSVREWTCPECGVVHDRDENAAVNLRDEGMRLYWLVAAALPPGRVPPSVIRASEPAEVLLAA